MTVMNSPLMLARYFRCRSANIAVAFALIAPLLLAFAGAGIDYARYGVALAAIQEIADAAAISGARQWLINRDNVQLPKAIAQKTAESGLQSGGRLDGAELNVVANAAEASVAVSIAYSMRPSFLVALFKNPIAINVEAVAQVSGGANVCMIALDKTATSAILLDGGAAMSGGDCAVYSNSKSEKGISVFDNARLVASLTCSAGGYQGPASNYEPAPLTDCPERDNPLSNRAAPSFTGCDHTDFSLSSGAHTLQPGVYCGGLSVVGDAAATFTPGVYVISDGELKISNEATAAGAGVAFFFTGLGAKMTIDGNADIDFTAPSTGLLAGLLIFEDPNGDGNRVFKITSPNAKRLVGTIYLPLGRFLAESGVGIAEDSEYTAIIARRIELNKGVKLVLNADYNLTTVPVPEGLAGGRITLRQ